MTVCICKLGKRRNSHCEAHAGYMPKVSKKSRKGSLRRAAQDLALLFTPLRELAYWTVENDVPEKEVLKLVKAAIRGERKSRKDERNVAMLYGKVLP